MPTATAISSLIEQDPRIRNGRPCLAGTGVTVHRVALWYNSRRASNLQLQRRPLLSASC
ncbi:MAG: DUF433 domain-containing protein [bacterium]|nr:DUF433 domain-containing protein [bacterium]